MLHICIYSKRRWLKHCTQCVHTNRPTLEFIGHLDSLCFMVLVTFCVFFFFILILFRACSDRNPSDVISYIYIYIYLYAYILLSPPLPSLDEHICTHTSILGCSFLGVGFYLFFSIWMFALLTWLPNAAATAPRGA